eukprot:6500611-Prymnesium_polylepis.1
MRRIQQRDRPVAQRCLESGAEVLCAVPAGLYGFSLVDSAAAFTAAPASLDASASAAVAFTLSCAGTAA